MVLELQLLDYVLFVVVDLVDYVCQILSVVVRLVNSYSQLLHHLLGGVKSSLVKMPQVLFEGLVLHAQTLREDPLSLFVF